MFTLILSNAEIIDFMDCTTRAASHAVQGMCTHAIACLADVHMHNAGEFF